MKLIDYLVKHDLTQAEFARRIGRNKMVVSHWLKGNGTPNTTTMKRIIETTGGEVMPNDFFS